MFQTLVRDYPYVHTGIGLFGNLLFFLGSILFFKTYQAWHTIAVWMFVIGSAGMLLGSCGQIVKSLYQARERRRDAAVAASARDRMAAG